MSYTVVVDEQERARRHENSLNILVRRCKIGKVKRKAPVVVPTLWGAKPVWQPPLVEGWPTFPHYSPALASPGTGDFWRHRPYTTC